MTDPNDESPVEVAEQIDTDGMGPVVLASVGSVLLALYFYYIRGDKQRGQFVGLWPVTILGLASYLKLKQISEALSKLAN